MCNHSYNLSNGIFTITAEIHACSLANFYCQYFLYCLCGQTHEFKIHATRQRARAGNSTICYRKKQIDVKFLCVCPVIDHEFRHHIVKEVCGSTGLSPRGSKATLTMWWWNSWSITGQTHKKLTLICFLFRRIPVVLESCIGHLRGGWGVCTPCTLLLDPPLRWTAKERNQKTPGTLHNIRDLLISAWEKVKYKFPPFTRRVKFPAPSFVHVANHFEPQCTSGPCITVYYIERLLLSSWNIVIESLRRSKSVESNIKCRINLSLISSCEVCLSLSVAPEEG